MQLIRRTNMIDNEITYYKLTHPQKGIWYAGKINPKSPLHNIGGSMSIEGIIDVEIMKRTINLIIENSDSLRLRFIEVDGYPMQYVVSPEKLDIDFFDFSKFTNPEESYEAWSKKVFSEVFDLSGETLSYFAIYKVNDEQYGVLSNFHHIIADGSSAFLIQNQICEIYDKLIQGLDIIFNEECAYINYIQDEKKYLESERFIKNRFFWHEKYKDISDESLYNSSKNIIGSRSSLYIGLELTNRIKRYIENKGCSLNTFFVAATFVYIFKITNEKDIIIGNSVHNRTNKAQKHTVGMFASTLPLRLIIDPEISVGSMIEQLSSELRDCYRNQKYPHDLLLQDLEIRRFGYDRLFKILVNYHNMGKGRKMDGKDIKVNLHYSEHQSYPTRLTVEESDENNIELFIDYKIQEHTEEEIRAMQKAIINIAQQMLNDKVLVSDIDILTDSERNKILYEFNDTYAEYPRDKTIHELFEEQVLRTPDNIALVFGDDSMTYSELNAKSSQLAHMLRSKGVHPDGIVGIMVERSFEMIIGIMGILKAGGAYLPIDTEYPEERIRFMLEDSNTGILLSQSWFKDKVVFDGEWISLDDTELYVGEVSDLDVVNSSDNLAYVMYTSGSTGIPKGAMVEHRSVVNFIICQIKKTYELTEKDRILQSSPFSFDPSMEQIFIAILGGASLYLVNRDTMLDLYKFRNFLHYNAITYLYNVPSFLKKLDLDGLNDLKMVISGGEICPINLAKRISKNFKMYNGYGPVEATVKSAMYFPINPECINDTVPIGKPLSNTNIYIIYRDENLAPIGIPGELCIGGEGLARGYLNRPELTAEKFVDNPFKPGERMYRTGDLARWLPDGNIEFLGRIDHQVKIRGFRIELGEIESRLLELEQVKEAVVLAKDDESGDKYLCAYIVSDEEFKASDIRTSLSATLPDYMVPSYFMRIDSIPLTPNGKVDRRSLPEPDGVVGTEYVAPRNAIEEALASIWSEVLNKEQVGINDNFFELGGHSLKGIALISRIHKELSVEVPLRELFKAPTISSISEYISGASESIYASIEPAVEKAYYEASSAQKRIWLLQQFDTASIGYNMPGILILDGDLDKTRLEPAFRGLISRHEALRTSFDMVEGEIVQRIIGVDEVEFEIDYAEISEAEVDSSVIEFVRAFDLSQAPLLRVGLVKESDTRHYLMFDMHHIISDGTSMAILTKEFMALYEGHRLNAQRLQYKDFSQWQNVFLKSEQMQGQEQYWLERFSDELPVLNLPLDYTRPSVQEFAGDSTRFVIGEDLTEKLRKIARGSGTTMYMVLLSAVNILLSKYSGLEDIIVGSPIAGRPHADLEGIMGMFVNTLVMRSNPAGDKTYLEHLREVKETALQAYENQDYQFEELIDKLDLSRDLSRNPLFDVMFVLQNMEASEFELEGLKLSRYNSVQGASKFDLTFSVVEAGNEITMSVEYATSLFKAETIERMSLHLQNLLGAIAEDREILLGDIDILSESERNQLMYEFNNTYADYPRDKAIHELFEEQVLRTPDNIALVFGDDSMTYSELNAKSNQLAHMLRRKGVQPDSIVGIMVERSFEMIIGIMGILKAGGAYLPIDPEYPVERIQFMLEDSNTEILLSQSWFKDTFVFDGERIDLDDTGLYVGESTNLTKINTSGDLAYVIYTSGSTGMPKGVMVEHQSIVNRLIWAQNEYPLVEGDVILQKTTYAFDYSIWELLWWTGASICLLEPGKEKEPEAMIRTIEKHHVTAMHFVPSMLSVFLDYVVRGNGVNRIKTLKKVFASGEALNPVQVKNFYHEIYKANKTDLINLYGPTEAAEVTYFDATADPFNSIVPIGKPIDNFTIYILGKNNSLLPISIPGELCIGGEGLARGYQNRPELTAEKFVDNPFKPGERMYRTGDLARWLPDGNIEFLGRIDHQVKIRGFRIELGEIESRLLELEQVKEAVVLAKDDDSGDKYLCAYIVSNTELNVSDIRTSLSATLPDYMIPSYFIRIDSIPLTSNGKVDRRSLPEPEGVVGTEYIAPRNAEEMALTEAFNAILGIEQVSISDDFFALGGDSIKAIRIISKLRELGYELSVRDLMTCSIVEQISKKIKKVEGELAYNQGEEVGELPLTPVQKWFFTTFESQPNHFNMAIMLKMTERIDTAGLEKVFDALIKHHDVLRTVFRNDTQKLLSSQESKGFELYEYDYRESGLSYTEVAKEIETRNNEIQASLNIGTGPLMKIGLFRTETSVHLMISIHHLVIDGVSWRILMEDIELGYHQYKNGKEIEFSKKTASFKDWAEALTEYSKSSELQREVTYWRQVSKQVPEGYVQESLTDLEEVGLLTTTLNSDYTDKLLYHSGKAFKTEINDLLLSSLGIAFHKLSGQKKISINLEGHGREAIHKRVEIDRTVGWFTSIYPVVIETYEEIQESIIRTKEMLRKIPNKGLGYGVLKYLAGEKFGEREAQITFNYLGSIVAGQGMKNEIFAVGEAEYSKGNDSATENMPNDICINCIIAGSELSIRIDYRKGKFNDEVMLSFSRLYIEALKNVIDTCVSQKKIVRTASDFGLSDDKISQDELEEIITKLL